MAVDGNP